jgi:hypothetical protein
MALTWDVMDQRISPCPTTGCWLWMLSGVDGYGRTSHKGRLVLAHRMFWTAQNGDIPAGMVLDHVCRTRACVNPDHLRVVTPRQNTLENSIGFAAVNTAKTACPECGSEYTPTNRTSGKAGRWCAKCNKRQKALSYYNKYASSNPKSEVLDVLGWCVNGHPLNAATRYVNPYTGAKACRMCLAVSSRKIHKRKQEGLR